MYYEEKMVDGIMCRRNDPKAEWIPFTVGELSTAFKLQQLKIARLEMENEKLKERMREVRELLG